MELWTVRSKCKKKEKKRKKKASAILIKSKKGYVGVQWAII